MLKLVYGDIVLMLDDIKEGEAHAEVAYSSIYYLVRELF